MEFECQERFGFLLVMSPSYSASPDATSSIVLSSTAWRSTRTPRAIWQQTWTRCIGLSRTTRISRQRAGAKPLLRVVTNTTPLIALAQCDLFSLWQALFGQVLVISHDTVMLGESACLYILAIRKKL